MINFIIAGVVVVVVLVIFLKVMNAIKSRREEKLATKAGQGDAQAQFEMGLKRKKEKDYFKALIWLQKAADQGLEDVKPELVEECNNKLKIHLEKLEKRIEKKGFENYKTIKECCNLLSTFGYKIKYDMRDMGESCFVSIEIYKSNREFSEGSIEICTHAHTAFSTNNAFMGLMSKNEYLEYRHQYKHFGYDSHIIQLEKAGILMTSSTSYSEAPKEWMMICARFLAERFRISYPGWVEQYPEAKAYVNVAFRNLEKL
jgi:hypothetical protein